MQSEDELKEINIRNHTCYYLDDIIEVMDRDSDFDFNDVLLNQKSCKEQDENIFIYDI